MLLPEALHAPSYVGLLGAGHFVQCQGQWREQGVHDRAAALTVSSGVVSRRQRPVRVRGTGAVTSVGSLGVLRRKMPYLFLLGGGHEPLAHMSGDLIQIYWHLKTTW